MSDLISRSALIEEIKKRSEYYLEDWDSFRKYTGGRAEESYAHFEEDKAIIKIANNLPTVEPVRGEWIYWEEQCEYCMNRSTCPYPENQESMKN